MWWSRRKAVAGLLALGGCGFTPVYGPQGTGTRLLNAVALPDQGTDDLYVFSTRFEERLGRGPEGAPYALRLKLEATDQDTGTTSAGNVNRVRLIGRALYSLNDSATGAVLHEGRTNAFTAYGTTGSTVATRAAARDARERLMMILADQVIDDLVLHAADFPA
jgi:LPS-assembly lipoprotein